MSTIGIIIKREYVERIKSRSFLIGTLLVVAGMFVLAFMPLLANVLGSPSRIIVLAPDQAVAHAISGAIGTSYDVTISTTLSSGATLPANIAEQVKAKKYDGALVAYRTHDGLAFTFYPRQANLLEKTGALRSRLIPVAVNADLSGDAAASAKRAINFKFSTVALNERYKTEGEETLAGVLVLVLIVLLYIATLLYGIQVAQGVVEEKSNRVMEVMIGAVRPAQLLAGKIFGIGALALTQMVIFALAAAGAAIVLVLVIASTLSHAEAVNLARQAAAAQSSMPGGSTVPAAGIQAAMTSAIPLSTFAYLLIFFIIGFFSYAAMFAGIGAMCSRSEDVQQVSSVGTIPVIISYFAAIFALNDPDKPIVVVASMIPLLSPMVMFTRVATSNVPGWQIGLAIALSLVAIWALTLMAGKLYRVGVLMYGKPPKPGDILRALRAPS